MEYFNQYLESFQNGLGEAIFEVEGSKMNSSKFLTELINAARTTQSNNGRIFFFGNGASSSIANHMALDWSKNAGVLALSLSDSALITAISNDYSFEEVYKEFAKINNLSKNDLIVTISSSGNSPSILRVIDFANEIGVVSIAFSGMKFVNQSREKAKFSIYYPFKTYGMVECAHQLYLHLWFDAFMQILEWDRKDIENLNIQELNI